MKILFLWNGMTHYFNLVTSKINKQPGVEIVYVNPLAVSTGIGDGVFQTKAGADFEIIELVEKYNSRENFLYFENLDKILSEKKPDIILVTENHLKSLVFDQNTKLAIERGKIKVILKTIPFRLNKYRDDIELAKVNIKTSELPPLSSVPAAIRRPLKTLAVDRLYKKMVLDKRGFRNFLNEKNLQRQLYNFVDAHVNYIEEAYDIYGSYGVPREKIFITYNSPDTDHYLAVRAKIEQEEPILPENNFRIIHVSRLVEWKRVDMLVEAVANLKEEFPRIELLVIGSGPELDNLIKQAAQRNVSDAIRFLGGVYEVELLGKYLMASSIYILAGMGGLSINDAMIFGLPVICSVCDGTEKYLVKEGYNGLYFENGNQKSLEEKISYLFKNPALGKQMGEKSTGIIKNEINIHTVVDGYMRAFNYVLRDA